MLSLILTNQHFSIILMKLHPEPRAGSRVDVSRRLPFARLDGGAYTLWSFLPM